MQTAETDSRTECRGGPPDDASSHEDEGSTATSVSSDHAGGVSVDTQPCRRSSNSVCRDTGEGVHGARVSDGAQCVLWSCSVFPGGNIQCARYSPTDMFTCGQTEFLEHRRHLGYESSLDSSYKIQWTSSLLEARALQGMEPRLG